MTSGERIKFVLAVGDTYYLQRSRRKSIANSGWGPTFRYLTSAAALVTR